MLWPDTLIYVSCGWQAFKRDCEDLVESRQWHLESACGYQFFPGTDRCAFQRRGLFGADTWFEYPEVLRVCRFGAWGVRRGFVPIRRMQAAQIQRKLGRMRGLNDEVPSGYGDVIVF